MDVSSMSKLEILALLETVSIRLEDLGIHAFAFNLLVVGAYEAMAMSQLLFDNHLNSAHDDMNTLLNSLGG